MNNIVPTSIKIKKELHEKIVEDAKKEKRSVTKQIEFMIEKYYEIKEKMS